MSKIPFNKKELTIAAPAPDHGMYARFPVLDSPITPKENFRRYFTGGDYQWMPLWGDCIMITPNINADNIARGFVFENRPFDAVKEGGGKDMFGVEWEYVPTVTGSMVRPGKPFLENVADWKDVVKFPDLDAWDWEGSAEINKSFVEDQTRFTGITILNGLFERLISFCEMNNAMIFMIDEDSQPYVKELFDALADFYIDLIRRYKKYFNIDYITFHDDWGSQRAPFFSPDLVREMLLPPLKKIIKEVHDLGMVFELHSCGKNEMLVPVMIEADVDLWDGQDMNDKFMLMEKYKDARITFGITAAGLGEAKSDEEIAAIMKDFVEKTKGYHVIGGSSWGSQVSRDYGYMYSRIALGGTED